MFAEAYAAAVTQMQVGPLFVFDEAMPLVVLLVLLPSLCCFLLVLLPSRTQRFGQAFHIQAAMPPWARVKQCGRQRKRC
jgi:hypothetical protein